MIIKLLRYIIGFVKFKSSGGFAERFLNLCDSENIPVWNIKNSNGEITGFTSIGGYKKLRSISKKSGMKTRIVKKNGLRFFLTQNKLRSGLAFGAVAMILIMITLSQFVWRIEVVGNINTEEEEILLAFEEYGVKIGAKISNLDLKTITSNVISTMPQISWASVNKKGSLLCIEVREKRETPKIYDDITPTNVIANEDGLIISSDILQGTEEVKPGSAVKKGDLLISGIIKYRDGSEKVVHADGFVRAETKDKFSISSQNISVYQIEDYKKCSDLFFFGFVIPIGVNPSGEICTESASYLKSGDNILPVGVIKKTGLEFGEQKIDDEEVLRLICMFKCAEHIKELTNIAEVKSSNIAIQEENLYTYKLNTVCEKDIGKLQEIYIEKTNDIA